MFYLYIMNVIVLDQKNPEVTFSIKWFVKQCKQSESTLNLPTKRNGRVHIQQRLESHEE